MTALHRKLVRELWSMRGQALAIALVIASGMSMFVMSRSTLESLKATQAKFYGDYSFARVFAGLKRAPQSLAQRIAEIPGVAVVETRVVARVNLDIEGYPDPASALLVSYDPELSRLNRVYLRRGRYFDPLRDDEAVVSEAFAEAQNLVPGDFLSVIINGRKKRLTIVGMALSPEYVYQIQAGSMVPDFSSYAILWMARKPLATAYDMDGAFNDVALTLSAKGRDQDVIDRLDSLLARYGGLGAYRRADQYSHRYLSEEFKQLESMATMLPAIFLAVAAFLLNVVFSRLIRTQREQAATLKAFGYSNLEILSHYLQFVAAVGALGCILGVLGGAWLGAGLSKMYMEFYRFPYLRFQISPEILIQAILITLGASFAGTIYALWRASSTPPAEAMRPEPPARFRRTLLERLGLGRLLSEPTRMIVRSLQRHPFKALLGALGIAASYAILMMGIFFRDSIDYMIDVQYRLVQSEDLSATFVEPTSRKALFELLRLPGVEYGEAFRSVPVRLRYEQRSYRTAIQGLQSDARLYRLLDADLVPLVLPAEGLLLTDYLADLLGAKVGDTLTVETLEGARPIRQVRLAGVNSQLLGVSASMRIQALNRMMREGSAISGVRLKVDRERENEVYRAIKQMPRIAGSEVQRKSVESLYETMGEQVLIFASITTLLAATVAFGVIYNSARITLSERERELASLRVLGYTRGEAAWILLGEMAILTLVALPLGAVGGWALCRAFIQGAQTDLFRIPLVLEPRTYAYGALVVLVCSVVSGMIVWRRVNRLDLVGVLKTRE